MRPVLAFLFHGAVVLATVLTAVAFTRGQDGKPRDPGNAPPADATLEDLLAAHNKARAEEKKPPLKLNDRLTKAARAHARDMAEHTKLTHDGSDGSESKTRVKRAGYIYQETAENVAAGQGMVDEVMREWLGSPLHRDNILGPFTEMGGAVEKGADGRNYWCVDFGRPIPPVNSANSPREMIAALNRARTAARKKALRSDPQLARVAAEFASQAAERKSLSLKDRDGRTPFEILEQEGYQARRFGTTLSSGEGEPAKVVEGWMARPKDRDALLSGFEYAGVGVATDSDGIPYWVLLLAQGVVR